MGRQRPKPSLASDRNTMKTDKERLIELLDQVLVQLRPSLAWDCNHQLRSDIRVCLSRLSRGLPAEVPADRKFFGSNVYIHD